MVVFLETTNVECVKPFIIKQKKTVAGLWLKIPVEQLELKYELFIVAGNAAGIPSTLTLELTAFDKWVFEQTHKKENSKKCINKQIVSFRSNIKLNIKLKH